jgi:type IX secretion system PorP/SprF family membrane protein
LNKNIIYRILIIAVLTAFTGLQVKGQPESARSLSLAYPVYSQYLHNGLVINPAYAGSREALSIVTSVRKQWLNIDNSPLFESVSAHTLLKGQRVGLGITGQLLSYGLTRGQSVYGHYAFHLKTGSSGRLSFGLRGGFDRTNTDYSIFRNDPDGLYDSDLAFNGEGKPLMLPNLGTGVYFQNDKIFAGLSVPNILSYTVTDDYKPSIDSYSKFDILFTAGALLSFSDRFRLKPSVLVEYPLEKAKELRIDLNANMIIADLVWIGGSYRTSENVFVSILQIQATQGLMLGFSYDLSIGNLSQYNSGSAEIILRYEFGTKVVSTNPRYF